MRKPPPCKFVGKTQPKAAKTKVCRKTKNGVWYCCTKGKTSLGAARRRAR